MNKKYFQIYEDRLFSNDTHKNNYDSSCKSNSCQDSSETDSSINDNSNNICQNISLNIGQNKKYCASFPLNLINESHKLNRSSNNKNSQQITLHSVNKSNVMANNENINDNRNKGIQHIVLKSLKRNKFEKDKTKKSRTKDTNNENEIVFNNNDIIRVIIFNDKLIKNFPVEYLNEMISDICNNLINVEYNLGKILSAQCHCFSDSKHFLEKRKNLFNFILHLSMNSSLSDTTLFLIYNIFDRYVSIKSVDSEELLLIIIASFTLAIKYTESTIPNLDELCNICGKKFNKEQINKYEINIMEALNYNISYPTIFDLFQFIKVINHLSEKEYYLGLFILEMFVISGGILQFNPLIILESIYLLVIETSGKEKKMLNLYKYASNFQINIVRYTEEVNNCYINIKEECIFIKEKNFNYLIKKFSSDNYHKISVDFQLI